MPIVRKNNLASIDQLCDKVRQTNSALRREVVDAMTTNETLFFRDVAPFHALRNSILPPLLERRKLLRKLSFWSAAASSGQEAYSLAMMLLEMGLKDWTIDILGTDLSSQMVERARSAKYMQIEVNRGLPAPYLVKYFTRQGLDWAIKDDVRRMVRFEQFDLRQNMKAMGPFDVVFCRNVLIYFDVATKKKILGEIFGTLHRGGHLILGAAETTLNLDDRFTRTPVGDAIFYLVP
jgi:chemotaxis protein methyltransferase CheR